VSGSHKQGAEVAAQGAKSVYQGANRGGPFCGDFCELSPRTPFAPSWHHEIIAAIPGTARKSLPQAKAGGRPSGEAAVRDGRTRRLIINVPPRHLESHLASVAFPARCLGLDPSIRILCVSYAQDVADKLSRDRRHIVTGDWYRQVFATRLSAQRRAVSEFETTAQGCRLATSVGGVLTRSTVASTTPGRVRSS
jgi:hypothetical protein